jgi:class 3 adenylate cyclase
MALYAGVMIVGADEDCLLPVDPALAEVAAAMDTAGHAAWIVDEHWRFVYVSRDARSLWVDRAGGRLGSVAIGHHVFSTESLQVGHGWRFGLNSTELWRRAFRSLGPLALFDTAGDAEELRSAIDPSHHDLVDDLVPSDADACGFEIQTTGLRGPVAAVMLAMRIRSREGCLRGTALLGKPAAPMSVLGGMAWERDLPHLERMERFTRAGRHPCAILFADVENSSALIRAVPTADYFRLGRRLVRVADECVVDGGGIVGRHVGDGVVAFFPAECFRSESEAARASIETARALRTRLDEIATRSGLDPGALSMRFGLHWGATVFMGKISTLARAEVTALGNDVNVAARIEQSATGGRLLASEALVSQLDAADGAALGADPARVDYTPIEDVEGVTAKARRDARGIVVCEL